MPSRRLPKTAQHNIETISRLQQELLSRASFTERLGEAIARFFGSLAFIVIHILFVAGWIIANGNVISGLRPFDPYPFPLLALVVGIEFILLTTFVLMNQSAQSRRQEEWADLTLHLCLLTEQEVTKNMQMLRLICQGLGINQPNQDKQAKELARKTPVDALADEISKVSNGKSP
jgi:uncharacterized membrane protein